MNPNDASLNQNTTTSPASTGVSSSTVVSPVAPQSVPSVPPVTPASPSVTPTPVASAPVVTPVPQAPSVTQSVVMQEVTPTPVVNETRVTQIPVTPVAQTPNTPNVEPMPAPAPASPVASVTPMPTDPNAQIKPINLSGTQTVTEVPPQAANTEQTVITTATRSKGSNVILVIVIIILIAFAFNIDTILEYYENYMETGSLTKTNNTSNNVTTDGFVKIDEATANVRVNNIKFYNFKKTNPMNVNFNYQSFNGYDNPESLEIYIELYDSNKNLIYVELFNPGKAIEKNTTVNYSMSLDSDVYEKAYYAQVKTYTASEKNASSVVTCKLTDSDYNYENKYTFKNNSLESYEVTMESISENKAVIEEEYNKVKDSLNATYENNILKYSVDLNSEINGFSPEYKKGLTPQMVKYRSELKKWICE